MSGRARVVPVGTAGSCAGRAAAVRTCFSYQSPESCACRTGPNGMLCNRCGPRAGRQGQLRKRPTPRPVQRRARTSTTTADISSNDSRSLPSSLPSNPVAELAVHAETSQQTSVSEIHSASAQDREPYAQADPVLGNSLQETQSILPQGISQLSSHIDVALAGRETNPSEHLSCGQQAEANLQISEYPSYGPSPRELEESSQFAGGSHHQYVMGILNPNVYPPSQVDAYPAMSPWIRAITQEPSTVPAGQYFPSVPLMSTVAQTLGDGRSTLTSIAVVLYREQPGSQRPLPSDCLRPGYTYGSGTVNMHQCTCSRCLFNIFLPSDPRDSGELHHPFELHLRAFFLRSAAVHHDAMRLQSSLYAAAERFVCDYQNISVELTAFAVLRQEYDLMSSPASQDPFVSELTAAREDLLFGFVVTGPATDATSLDRYLHNQQLADHLESERVKRAVWDLSRLPPGSHVRDSTTFAWLRRSLFHMNTSSRPRVAMDLQSGNDQYQFRRFHRVLLLASGSNKATYTPELYSALEPKLQRACVKTCQEWFIAVLDEAAKFEDQRQQLQFVEANNAYMFECIEGLALGLVSVGVERPIHICSRDCNSHFRPPFKSIVQDAHSALKGLFSPPESVLQYIREPLSYPTQNHIRLSRVIGLVQHNLYFSDTLLPEEKRIQHLESTRPALLNARTKLSNACGGSALIWNYLPVDVARRAESKLERALEVFGQSRAAFISP